MAATTNRQRSHRPDYKLILSVFILLVVGLIMMYSISPVLSHKLFGSTDRNFYFYGQLKHLTAGLLVWWLVSRIPYQNWKIWAPKLLLVAIVALVALMIPGLGVERNGATRWLNFGLFSFQPAELLKLALILYMAAWFEKRGEAIRTFWDGLLPFSLILAAASIAIVLFQRDMGSMVVVAGAAVGMFWVAGIRFHHLITLLATGVGFAIIAIVTFPHRLSRVAAFLNPHADATGEGYHISQALIAVGSGGVFGQGLGKSIQVYGYLPEAANDSIFAIIAEEFGLFGSLLVILLFGFLVHRGLKIAKAAPDLFGRLTATGIALWMFFQALVNIAAMLSLVPLTGIPLPFISYGGTSLVITLIGIGILLNISKSTLIEGAYADNRERRRNGWPYFTNPSNARRTKAAR